jgi:hypothetical protein
MKRNKEPKIRVNMCWELDKERKCATLERNDAYKTREWVEANNGIVFWFQALPN